MTVACSSMQLNLEVQRRMVIYLFQKTAQSRIGFHTGPLKQGKVYSGGLMLIVSHCSELV